MSTKEDFLLLLNSTANSRNFWKEYREFCRNLEKVDVELFFTHLPLLLKKIENDGSSRELINAIENASSIDTEFGNILYFKIINQSNLQQLQLLPNILCGLFKVEIPETILKIKNLIKSDDVNKIKLGIQSIAEIETEALKSNSEFLKFVEAEFKNIVSLENSKYLWPSILFVCRNKRDVINNADEIIQKLSAETNIEIQIELIYFLSYNLNIDKEEKLFKETLHKLIPLNIEYKGAYNQLSYTLSELSKIHIKTVLDFLNKWVAFDVSHAKNIELLEYLLNTIIDNDLNKYEELITNWLNSDNANYHIAVFEIMRANHIRDILEMKISKKLLRDMSNYDVEYITYKILGFIYDKNISTSMVYSILENKIDNQKLVNFLSDVFVTYFIFNYYGTIEFLHDKKKNAVPKMKKAIAAIIIEGEKHYSAYSELDILREFSPSEMRLGYIHKIQNKKFNKSFKEIEEKDDSFLSHLKNIQLKAGKTSFCKYMGQYSKQMELNKFSSGGELPRGEFIDPVGQKKLRRSWQNHKRKK